MPARVWTHKCVWWVSVSAWLWCTDKFRIHKLCIQPTWLINVQQRALLLAAFGVDAFSSDYRSRGVKMKAFLIMKKHPQGEKNKCFTADRCRRLGMSATGEHRLWCLHLKMDWNPYFISLKMFWFTQSSVWTPQFCGRLRSVLVWALFAASSWQGERGELRGGER